MIVYTMGSAILITLLGLINSIWNIKARGNVFSNLMGICWGIILVINVLHVYYYFQLLGLLIILVNTLSIIIELVKNSNMY